jgi:hypothetical protein
MSVEPWVAIRDLAFAHEAASESLFTGVTLHLPRGFTGVVGANGPCALLLVSHDRRFLERIARTRWHVDADGDGNSAVTVH